MQIHTRIEQQFDLGQLCTKLAEMGVDESMLELLTAQLADNFITNLPVEQVTSGETNDENFSAFSCYPGLVLVFNHSFKAVYQNKPFLGKVKITGQGLLEILQFINSPSLISEAEEVWKTGKPHKTSLINPINLRVVDVFLSKYTLQNTAYLVAFLEDISLKTKPAQLVERKKEPAPVNQYQLIANSISDIFFILDKKLRFTFIAPSIDRSLQYKYNELIGKGFDMLIPQWSGNTLKKNLDTVLALRPNIAEPQRFTIQLSGKYGKLNWYEVQITGIYNELDVLQGYNGVCRDITERLKYEEALRLAKKKAEESDRLKSAFLANMSHEIRTPLNGIIGFSTMLSNPLLPAEKKDQYAGYIISCSKQLLTLISDIIDISKIEAGQLSIFKTPVDVVKLMHETHETIRVEKDRLEKHDIRLKMVFRERELNLFTDEVRLRQVMINLLSNALKFTKTGKIEFGFQLIEKDAFIRFYVKDTGVGIPHPLQKAVFERFRQGDVDSQAKVTGTGLGLAISKGIINLMCGKIGLLSEPGKGSEFFFVLPYQAPADCQ